LLTTTRVGPIESRRVYALPDYTHYTWESRRHRKRRGPVRPAGMARRAAPVDTASESWQGGTRWLVWAPHRITWWVGVVFAIGSALFVLGAVASLYPALAGGREAAQALTMWSEWTGAVLFTLATYLWWLEGINDSDYIGLEPGDRPPKPFRWIAWQPRQLGFVAPLLFLIGSLIWNLETSLALGHWLGWLAERPLWTAVSSTAGAVLFLVPSYLQVIEVCPTTLCWQPRKIAWWVTVLFGVGCVAFLIGAVVEFNVFGLSREWVTQMASGGYVAGSLLFLVGSYLMLPEITAA
jgi:hypothetical protein